MIWETWRHRQIFVWIWRTKIQLWKAPDAQIRSQFMWQSFHGNHLQLFWLMGQCHSSILAKSIPSKDRTWESLIVQASIWCVDPCSSGLDLQELKKISTLESKGGPQWKNYFNEVPPLVHGPNFFSSWRSRPLEHGSTHHGEAWTIKLFHVLTFDWINFAKIRFCRSKQDNCDQVFLFLIELLMWWNVP